MNCPNCGAVVKEGKFCNYCGAKLPDDTKRVEVKIDKRIEDVAEVRRASYEEKESEIRRKKEIRDYKARTVKRHTCLIILALSAIAAAIVFVFNLHGSIILIGIFGSVVACMIGFYILYLLITGKW